MGGRGWRRGTELGLASIYFLEVWRGEDKNTSSARRWLGCWLDGWVDAVGWCLRWGILELVIEEGGSWVVVVVVLRWVGNCGECYRC